MYILATDNHQKKYMSTCYFYWYCRSTLATPSGYNENIQVIHFPSIFATFFQTNGLKYTTYIVYPLLNHIYSFFGDKLE